MLNKQDIQALIKSVEYCKRLNTIKKVSAFLLKQGKTSDKLIYDMRNELDRDFTKLLAKLYELEDKFQDQKGTLKAEDIINISERNN